MTDFPFRKYTMQDLNTEFKKLIDKVQTSVSFPIEYSRIGYKCTNNFFQYERMLTPGINRPSSVKYWLERKENIIKFSKKQNRDYFSTVNYFNHSPSQFPIVAAAKIYRYFNAVSIFDPYAGWGDRCLAAISLNIKYTGIDSNSNLVEPYKNLLSNLAIETSIK